MSDRSYSMGSATEMMINDFDDERTLDEEEALEGSEDSHNELSNLQKEGDMPLKELLAKYGYSHQSPENSNSSDQMNLMHGGGDGRMASEKGENDADEYEDEDEDDEDDEDAEDDEDEDEDDENNVSAKISGDKMIKQLTLREFYVEMIKMDAKRMCIAGSNAADGLECDNVGDDHTADGGGLSGNGGTAAGAVGDESSAGGRGTDGTGSSNENTSGRGGASGGGGGGGGSSRLLRSVSRPQSEEEDDDCDYSPDEEEWKKTIMVGSDYQATIPEGLCKYDDALPYENEDKILWNPCFIPEEEVEEFLERAQLPTVKGSILPAGGHVRDDEQALYLLLQCGYSLEEALRRRRMNVIPPTDSISLWSEEECHNFESGLRTYGKDFHLIQRNKVRTRSVGELVQFYYLWKKTERHDIFTYKARMEKKKYALHPGITDYMDRFLEEQEGVRDRSSSPNVNCLLYGDAKRQRGSTNTLTNNHSEEVKSVETWDGVTTDDSLGDLNNMTTITTATSGTTAITTTATASTSPAPLAAATSSSPTPISGTPTSTDSSTTTTTSVLLGRTPAGAGTPTNHTHDTPRHGYSPSPENVLSNLPP